MLEQCLVAEFNEKPEFYQKIDKYNLDKLGKKPYRYR